MARKVIINTSLIKKELRISLITFNNIFKIKDPEKNIKKRLRKKTSLSTFVIAISVLGTVFFLFSEFFSSCIIFIGYFHCIHAVRRSSPEVLCKKVFLQISENSQENTCARVSFFNNSIILHYRGFPLSTKAQLVWQPLHDSKNQFSHFVFNTWFADVSRTFASCYFFQLLRFLSISSSSCSNVYWATATQNLKWRKFRRFTFRSKQSASNKLLKNSNSIL